MHGSTSLAEELLAYQEGLFGMLFSSTIETTFVDQELSHCSMRMKHGML
jgi:hypothetical protein